MHEFVAIGDIVTDTFIRLKEATVKCDDREENCTLTTPFGDKIPFESAEDIHAVGNSPNAAVAASRLGLKSALVSNLGDDFLGSQCLASLEQDEVAVNLISVHPDKPSNHHYVLWYGVDRTILVKHEAYDYKLPEFEAPKWIYLSSLGENTLEYHRAIANYLASHPEVKLAFQPGTFQINLGTEKLKDIYERTEILFCNIDEAGRILGIHTLGTPELLKRLKALGPRMVVLTDGPRGAYAYDGGEPIFVPVYPDGLHPFERTGAGDAFASTTVAALLIGKDLETALKWGAINSASVVQQVGAQKGLLTREVIESRVKKGATT